MSNNQYGICCECPAFMSDGRYITNWEPSRQYNYKLSTLLNVDNSNSFRKELISKPVQIISSFESTTCNSKIQLNKDSVQTVDVRTKEFIKKNIF